MQPLLVWYSQEARSYALLVLLGALTVLLFSRARARPTPGRLTAWSLVCALALLNHYFAVFLVLPEALLLWTAARDRRRAVILAIGGVAVVGASSSP